MRALARHDKALPIAVVEAFLEFDAYAELAGFEFLSPANVTQALDRSLHAVAFKANLCFAVQFQWLRYD